MCDKILRKKFKQSETDQIPPQILKKLTDTATKQYQLELVGNKGVFEYTIFK